MESASKNQIRTLPGAQDENLPYGSRGVIENNFPAFFRPSEDQREIAAGVSARIRTSFHAPVADHVGVLAAHHVDLDI